MVPMTTTDVTWIPSVSATDEENDQEADLGDGWHAIVGPNQGGWSWELWSTWLHDNEADMLASGQAGYEGIAKNAALTAHRALR